MKKYAHQIRSDSVATIRTQGILGDKYIEISIGSPNESELDDDAWIQSSEPEDLIARSGHLVTDIAKQFDKGGELDQLLRNLNRLVTSLHTLSEDINKRRATEKLASSFTRIDNILRKIEEGEGTLGALINDPSVYEDVKQVLGGAKRSTVLKYFMRQFIESGSTSKPPQR
jgi:phospholipid/cholesterol/gamma-HCH transport system substrate-binding protein